jgi:putative nucleotidyltransferase with HDIG domain
LFTAYAGAMLTASIVGFLVASWHAHLLDLPLSGFATVGLFTLLAIIAEELSVVVSDRVTITASNLPLLLGIMFLGTPRAVLTAALVGLWGSWREESAPLAVFNVSNFMLTTLLASLAFEGLRSTTGFSLSEVSVELLLAGAVAGLIYQVGALAFLSVGARLRYGRSLRRFWRSELAPLGQSLAILTGLGLAVAAVYAQAGVIAVALLFIPLFAAQYMFKLLVEQRRLLAEQRQLSDQYLEMNIGLAAAMVVLLDSKDEYTASHSAAVAMYCRDMALSLGMSEDEAEALHLAGLLHDLGKVGTPDAILRKDGKLDPDEWAFIHEHPAKGAEVLSHLAAYKDVADIVRYHHERLDGSGYPYGIRDGQIPELSKMLAVADAYHAMTSDRPYRPARSSFDALKELRRMSGVSLDGKYVELLASILRDKDLAYREGTSTDFMGEYERGRINLRLRAEAIAQISETMRARRDPAVG